MVGGMTCVMIYVFGNAHGARVENVDNEQYNIMPANEVVFNEPDAIAEREFGMLQGQNIVNLDEGNEVESEVAFELQIRVDEQVKAYSI